MASWTTDHSRLLSLLLDEAVGTQEMIFIRQDCCKIEDAILPAENEQKRYFTGSKAEGLDLFGSDMDYMYDMNDGFKIKVIQTLDESHARSPYNIYLMVTDNVHPGFTLLQQVHQTLSHPVLSMMSQNVNGIQYFNNDLLIQLCTEISKTYMIAQRQGPSIEIRPFPMDNTEPGIDTVYSIHCAFWPNEASEWAKRVRHFGWPTSCDLSSILSFGFHLVPIGYPLSDMKPLEWRISFSIAERTLVWSFNHVQYQCYAVMKIILKEFIKLRCSKENQILCSYFIKTFLFWKYETIELNFWRPDNLRECIKFLLVEFSKCIREGVLKHYFIPRFNLLSVKLTPAAQTELVQLLDTIIQSDVYIIEKCKSLQNVWSKYLQFKNKISNNVMSTIKRQHKLKTHDCMRRTFNFMYTRIESACAFWSYSAINKIQPLLCKTHFKTLVLKKCVFEMHHKSLIHLSGSGNKGVFQLRHIAHNESDSFDISTHALSRAILLLMNGDFSSTLNIVNKVLSSIPPFVMYDYFASNETKQLYTEMLLDSNTAVPDCARKAWMFDLTFEKYTHDPVPLAIQIELYFCITCVWLSPFTCAYYLQFLCYHAMGQYDNRDRALQQLTEVARNVEQCGNMMHFSHNIAGHCLLLAGKTEQARAMFNESYTISQMKPPYHEYNSALWYLMYCF